MSDDKILFLKDLFTKMKERKNGLKTRIRDRKCSMEKNCNKIDDNVNKDQKCSNNGPLIDDASDKECNIMFGNPLNRDSPTSDFIKFILKRELMRRYYQNLISQFKTGEKKFIDLKMSDKDEEMFNNFCRDNIPVIKKSKKTCPNLAKFGVGGNDDDKNDDKDKNKNNDNKKDMSEQSDKAKKMEALKEKQRARREQEAQEAVLVQEKEKALKLIIEQKKKELENKTRDLENRKKALAEKIQQARIVAAEQEKADREKREKRAELVEKMKRKKQQEEEEARKVTEQSVEQAKKKQQEEEEARKVTEQKKEEAEKREQMKKKIAEKKKADEAKKKADEKKDECDEDNPICKDGRVCDISKKVCKDKSEPGNLPGSYIKVQKGDNGPIIIGTEKDVTKLMNKDTDAKWKILELVQPINQPDITQPPSAVKSPPSSVKSPPSSVKSPSASPPPAVKSPAPASVNVLDILKIDELSDIQRQILECLGIVVPKST